MFKRLFGGGGGAGSKPLPSAGSGGKTAVTTMDAIQKLAETEELLTKRQDLLEKKIAAQLQEAKEFNSKGNKRAAVMALKKKKMYEKQVEGIGNNILRITEQKMMLEEQRAAAEAVDALRTGAHAGKATMQEMKIDDVDRVLDEINDNTDQMRQIQDALAAPIGLAAELDDDELLVELEDMEALDLDDQLLQAAPTPAHRIPAEALPSVPATKPQKAAAAKTPEELELEELAEFAS